MELEYHSFKEWKQLGYIVKKGEHSMKLDDDYKATYLFSEEQVIPIDSSNSFTIQELKMLKSFLNTTISSQNLTNPFFETLNAKLDYKIQALNEESQK